VGEREGATLISILRDAWDRGSLSTRARHNRQIATGAHVSFLGHSTVEELNLTLSDNNRVNGFANRYLFVCAQRSKFLPRGGNRLDEQLRDQLVEKLRKAFVFARGKPAQPMGEDDEAVESADVMDDMVGGVRAMGFSKGAGKLWDQVYGELSKGADGMLGAVTDRAEAQVRRIACIYALLDECNFVKEVHLKAALEVWRYCFESARYLFGRVEMHSRAMGRILEALRAAGKNGMSRHQIRQQVFRQNKSAEEIGRALQELEKQGRARRATAASTGGRPSEQWYAVDTGEAD
jgi:hypothetical protein